ncbi:MAG: HAD-IB family hydrolase [Candidatus Moranbacteria bacterium CG23_combo_of_CG06-09_8_20_14_all_39_10]|nr:MAG: HAD-IB family hydrolase [Candidatus Moranbacteria bacterium CG23_combo_of_CG06-09_8_20_14_all_39_10]
MSKKTKLAVFDIDGTIFRKNLAFELINELAWKGVFKKEVRQELLQHYTNWLDHKGTYEDYRNALVKLYFENLKGCKKEDVENAAKEVSAFFQDRTYVFAEDLIKKLRAQNYNIIAVSGSPSEIVEEYNKHLKFDAVFGSVYELDNQDKYTGQAVFEPTKDKSQVVRQYLTENNLTLEGSYGIGDTESDVPVLEIVENPIAFNPNFNLKEIAEQNNWKIIVEKKDVIYDLSLLSKAALG